MTTRRSWMVGAGLAAIWLFLAVWQWAEHRSARRSFHNMIVDRGRYITTTCGILMRGPFSSAVVSTERLEGALAKLVDTNELRFVGLLNTNGELLASAGDTNEMPRRADIEGGVLWGENTVLIENPVDLGTNLPQLVLPREELRALQPTNHPGASNNSLVVGSNGPGTNGPRRYDWRRQGRPYWMTEADYQTLIAKKGAHTFLLSMSGEPAREGIAEDLRVRAVILLLGSIAVAGCWLAWRGLLRASELQVRLVRASELNTHLKELNLAAAGLAHETRNPLNIIRGLAQLISKQQGAPPEVQAKARDIVGETDRVAAQLNEFINYSRPREVRRGPANLGAVANEVVRALNYDVEEKKIRVAVEIDSLTIEADEQLLRQALFNLVLNAIEAVPEGGQITIRAHKPTPESAVLEIADNGPGVSVENRTEVFKPYFTTHSEGTGLGLAVVQQIVLAHGWEIACLANEPAGALFRISHIKAKA